METQRNKSCGSNSFTYLFQRTVRTTVAISVLNASVNPRT